MKKITLFSTSLFILFVACAKEDDTDIPEMEIDAVVEVLDAYELSIVSYFKDIALGFEFGNSTEVTRKWTTNLNVFIGGETSAELLTEFNRIQNELNELITEDFIINRVEDSSQSYYYIFFGSGQKYAEIYPSQSGLVSTNWGLFSVFWDAQDQFTTGYMYVDINKANTLEQKHLLREEFTQSLGLAKDSGLYDDSIFQSEWTSTTEYSTIDRDLIRLLYHPTMISGLNAAQSETVLRAILTSE